MSETSDTQKLSRREREAAWRKQEIVEAASKLFVSRDYEETSLHDIAEASEFSVSTLYNFFENKEDIYFAVIEAELADLNGLARDAMSQVVGPGEKLQAFASAYFGYVLKKKEAVLKFWQEIGGFAWAVKERLHKRLQESGMLPLALLVPVIDDAKASGVTRDIDATEQAIVFRLMCLSYLFMWFRSGEKTDLVSFAPVVVERFLDGFGRRG